MRLQLDVAGVKLFSEHNSRLQGERVVQCKQQKGVFLSVFDSVSDLAERLAARVED